MVRDQLEQHIAEQNPLEELLGKRVKAIQDYHSQRTAEEFHQAVRDSFNAMNIQLQTPFFRDKKYLAKFPKTNGLSAISFLSSKGGVHYSGYQLFDAPTESFERDFFGSKRGKKRLAISVFMSPAYTIPGIEADIMYGNIPISKLVPFLAIINNKKYPLVNHTTWRSPKEIGFA